MPVAVRRDPFNTVRPSTDKSVVSLRVPQARVLAALMPIDQSDPPSEWPLLTRTILGIRAGYTATSGMVNRVLGGIQHKCKSGEAHPGILELELIEKESVEVDGVTEMNYRITAAGIQAYRHHITTYGKLPEFREKSLCVNDRYKEQV